MLINCIQYLFKDRKFIGRIASFVIPGFLNKTIGLKQRVVLRDGTWTVTDLDNKHPFICESGKSKAYLFNGF